jgi:hypothetical protein
MEHRNIWIGSVWTASGIVEYAGIDLCETQQPVGSASPKGVGLD